MSGTDSWAPDLNPKDLSWFGVTQSTWSGSQTNYGPAKSMDIAWSLNGNISHHLFSVTTVGSPTVSIVGLTRGQTVDYSTKFQVVATMASSLKPSFLFASLEQTPNWNDKRSITCSSFTASNSSQTGVNTYTANCNLNLDMQENYPLSLIITPYLDVANSVLTLNGDSVTVNVGKTGIQEFAIWQDAEGASHNYGWNYGGSLISLTPKTPWLAPATFTLKGSACVAQLHGNYCQQRLGTLPLAGATFNICVNNKCQSIQTQADGSFTFTQVVQAKSVQWTAAATYKGTSLPYDLDDNSGSTPVQRFTVSDTVSLATQPPPPPTKGQIKAAQQAMHSLGVKVMKSLTSAQLVQMGLLKFLLPGHNTVTSTYAQDFCRQIPTIIPGLAQEVGFNNNADPNYVSGCASVVMTIKLK